MTPHLPGWRCNRLHNWRASALQFVYLSCALVVIILSGCLVFGPRTASHASTGPQPAMVASDETLLGLAEIYHIGLRNLVGRDRPATQPPAFASLTLRQPTHIRTSQGQSVPSVGSVTRNAFPYGTCTWWANERYRQLHGSYVPWHTQANAWQWTTRAYQFHWRVSAQPSLGAIIDLQPGVQGASSEGHVGVVEQILPDGRVIVSNMSWGRSRRSVIDVTFTPGPGVTFLSAE